MSCVACMICMGGNMGGDNDEEEANIRATKIHLIGDLLQSIGVILAACIIVYDPVKFKIADPICTFIFSIIVFFTTTAIVKDCIGIIMEATPNNYDINVVKKCIDKIPGVVYHQDLHIWQLSSNKLCLTVHILTDDRQKNKNMLK